LKNRLDLILVGFFCPPSFDELLRKNSTLPQKSLLLDAQRK
jgi:hypothetical protein